VPAFLILALAIGNEVADYYEDVLVGKRNIVARVGRKKGVMIYLFVLLLGYVYIAFGFFFGLPRLSLLILSTAPLAFKIVQLGLKNYDNPQLLTKILFYTVILYLTNTTILVLSYIL
jgi:1,4-dihydroxy-2-naphthoate octaprenyltransferase